MKVEIVSPEGKLLETSADLVSLPGVDGSFGILNNHAPLVALLGKGAVKLQGKEVEVPEDFQDKFEIHTDKVVLQINSGTVEVKNNRVIILVE